MKHQVIGIATAAVSAMMLQQASAAVLINEVYGGGGNSGATYTNDYVELYNTGTSAVSLSAYRLDYTSATGVFSAGTSYNLSAVANASIAAGGYYLIYGASGGTAGTTTEPAADATTGINLSGTAGKLRLVSDATQVVVTSTASTGTYVSDFVGYGTTANQFEGTNGPAPAPSNTSSVSRNATHTDNNDNKNDFAVLSGTSMSPTNSGVAPAGNDTVISAPATAALGRIFLGQSGSVTITKNGTAATGYTAGVVNNNSTATISSVAPATGTFAAGDNQSQALSIKTTGTTANAGAINATVSVNNTATTSAGAGQGSNDSKDNIALTGNVVAGRQIGDDFTTGTGTTPVTVVNLGKVLVGATVGGSGTVATSGDDSSNTRVTLNGGVSGTFASGDYVAGGTAGYTVTLSTGPQSTLFNSSTSTAAVAGSGTFNVAGNNVGGYLSLSSSATGGNGKIASALTGEGLTGETVKTAYVNVRASAYSASNGSFTAGSDANSGLVDFGTVDQGSTASQSYNIYDLLGGVAGYTAGLTLTNIQLVSGSGPFSLGLTPGALVADGSDASNNFFAAMAMLNTSTVGSYDVVYQLTLADAADIQGGTSNQTPLTLELKGVVSAVPEPASLSLLGLGAIALVRRKRR